MPRLCSCLSLACEFPVRRLVDVLLACDVDTSARFAKLCKFYSGTIAAHSDRGTKATLAVNVKHFHRASRPKCGATTAMAVVKFPSCCEDERVIERGRVKDREGERETEIERKRGRETRRDRK